MEKRKLIEVALPLEVINREVTSWPEILDAARNDKRDSDVQSALNFEEGDD
jgi:hypothetical protein